MQVKNYEDHSRSCALNFLPHLLYINLQVPYHTHSDTHPVPKKHKKIMKAEDGMYKVEGSTLLAIIKLYSVVKHIYH